jgi:murein DD-endopeptidase MepM/ murein hydrolase activator NlpD
MRLLPLALLIALPLAACDQPTEQSPQPPAPAGAAPPAAAPPPAETAAEGGAEQLPGDPLPSGPASSAQPVGYSEPPGDFEHHAAGDLIPGSGPGYLDRTVWAPNLCFPMEGIGYANSQVYGAGGAKGPPGLTSQCDHMNYSLPWRDNFCEARGYSSPVCVGGSGHQGQDIRPATCQKAVHWVLAAEDGIVTDIGSYTVTLTASTPPHRVYRYLHMAMGELAVKEGDSVASGQRLGKTSNEFGSTPTTIHTHFEIRAGVAGVTTDGKPVVLHTFLPPYLSLVAAYQRKLDGVACHGS